MNCVVSLYGADGVEKKSRGNLTTDGGSFYLAFEMDGDSAVLEGNKTRIAEARRGKLETDITFFVGRRTACVLGGGELTVEIPVFTRGISLDLSDGLKLIIDYELGGAKIILNATAEYISREEKK